MLIISNSTQLTYVMSVGHETGRNRNWPGSQCNATVSYLRRNSHSELFSMLDKIEKREEISTIYYLNISWNRFSTTRTLDHQKTLSSKKKFS